MTPFDRVLQFVVLGALQANLAAQLDWQQWTRVARPPARHESALTRDVGSGLLLFGGSSNTGLLNDTWRWTSGGGWTQLNPTVSPPPRYCPRLCTDTGRGVVVLFGGMADHPVPPYMLMLADTWEWNGSNWTQLFPANSPPARFLHGLAYDTQTGRTVLFGGGDYAATPVIIYADTWEWSGVNWVQLSPATSPPAIGGHTMAYDAARSMLVMTARSVGTWEWDGSNWALRGGCPDVIGGRISYDEARGRVVWYGGADGGGHALPVGVLDWNGQSWTPRPTENPPPHRFWHMLAYDPTAECMVVFGGRDDSQPSLQQRKDDTWLLAPLFPATAQAFGVGCSGSQGTVALSAVSQPWLGTTCAVGLSGVPPGVVAMLAFGWSEQTWLGLWLPLPLGSIGMSGCSLYVSLDHAAAAIAPTAAFVLPFSLPNQASLIGQRLYLQGFAFDPAANPAGIAASNGLALHLGGL